MSNVQISNYQPPAHLSTPPECWKNPSPAFLQPHNTDDVGYPTAINSLIRGSDPAITQPPSRYSLRRTRTSVEASELVSGRGVISKTRQADLQGSRKPSKPTAALHQPKRLDSHTTSSENNYHRHCRLRVSRRLSHHISNTTFLSR